MVSSAGEGVTGAIAVAADEQALNAPGFRPALEGDNVRNPMAAQEAEHFCAAKTLVEIGATQA